MGENNDMDPDQALSSCLFSQYAMTFASVTTGTGYALWKRPPNGIGIMLVAGAGGSLLDLVYGWNFACVHEVEAWRKYHRQQQSELVPIPPSSSSKK